MRIVWMLEMLRVAWRPAPSRLSMSDGRVVMWMG